MASEGPGLEGREDGEAALTRMEEEEDERKPLLLQHQQSRDFKCCSKEMELLEFRHMFVIRSVDPDVPNLAFSIGRTDGVIQSLPGDSDIGTPIKISTIYGVVGTIRLLAGTYVLVITSRKEVTSHLDVPVFVVKSMKFLSCNEAIRNSTSQEKSDEAYFMTLLKTVETIPGLYYSYEADLTLNLQRSHSLAKKRLGKPLWKQADPRFVWNQKLLEELIECKLDEFTIPLIQGSFQSVQVMLKSSPAKITLISRRCTRRLGIVIWNFITNIFIVRSDFGRIDLTSMPMSKSGTRMWSRGANLEGDTANFIETEQLIEFEGFISSFLQVRGSIPLLWEQIVDLSYKPRLNILNHEETPKVVERHFHDLMQRYGETVAVDLTDKHGDEGQLSKAYASEMEKLPHVRYVSFDFHRICGNANFDNLHDLYEQISDDIEKQGYFMLYIDGQILLEQKGIIRVNCIDCLDRTNVTQSYLAKKSLDMQLQKMGIFSSSDSISMYPELDEHFKILWVDNGDEISLEYSGTHALKRDLVRFGRQTLSGLIKDGMSAMSRYYLNNFQDGIRQDALDLISGRYTISRNGPSPFQLNGFESLSYLPIASALIVGGLTATTFTLNQATRNAQHFVSSVLWAGLAAGVVAVVKANGRQFCSRPRLCNLL